MTTVRAIIFHCIRCGRVVHSDTEQERPSCCGEAMAHACSETVDKKSSHSENVDEDLDSSRENNSNRR